jgi:hypothetical protein
MQGVTTEGHVYARFRTAQPSTLHVPAPTAELRAFASAASGQDNIDGTQPLA